MKFARLSSFLCIYLCYDIVFAAPRQNGRSWDQYLSKAKDLLDQFPLIDGHNDFVMLTRSLAKNQLSQFNMTDLTLVEPWMSSKLSHTDITRLRRGKVGAQFWSAYVGCGTQYKDAVQKTYEQIDVIRRMADAYPETFQFVGSVQEIRDAFANKKIASLIGVEGGHSIGSSLANLRIMYQMGTRYLTLTHSCTTPWADNSQLDNFPPAPVHNGLTSFGEVVIREMNRLGMLVDLSHVSKATMLDVLDITEAPVIFSHSSAYAVCNNTRNVQDDVLTLVKANGGIVMVNFYPEFVTCSSSATVQDVADHIEHIRDVAGVDHVGIGGDYNGIELVPEGLEDVSSYPNLFAELLSRGWSELDLQKLAGENLLRVFSQVEAVRDSLAASGRTPYEDWIPEEDLAGNTGCMTQG